MHLFILAICIITAVNGYWIDCPCQPTTQIIPGAQYTLIGGLDLTELATNVERTFKSNIFQYHYNNNQCMRSVFGGDCFRIPDEIAVYDIDTESCVPVTKLCTTSYCHTKEYAKSYQTSSNIDKPNYHMSIMFHNELYDSNFLMTSDYVNQGYSYYSQSTYQLVLYPDNTLTFDDKFNNSLASLPSTIKTDEDRCAYNEFLIAYGGYYNIGLTMGGGYHMNQYIDQYYAQTYQASDIMDQMNTGFSAQMFQMEMGYWSDEPEYQTSQDYKDHSDPIVYCYGGNLSYACTSKQWNNSIFNNPAYLKVTYDPLYLLVTDDEAKRNTLRYQIDQYTRTGKLDYEPC